MSHRLSDEVIERFRADAEVGIADEGHGTETTDREVLAMVTEIQESRAVLAAAKRLVENAETIVIESATTTPYTPKMVLASDLADVLSGRSS